MVSVVVWMVALFLGRAGALRRETRVLAGRLDRLTYDDVRALNPQVIFLEHVPVGMRGPMGGDGGYDGHGSVPEGGGSMTARRVALLLSISVLPVQRVTGVPYGAPGEDG